MDDATAHRANFRGANMQGMQLTNMGNAQNITFDGADLERLDRVTCNL